jgi:hypothetical protein
MARRFLVMMLVAAVAAFLVFGSCSQEKKAGTPASQAPKRAATPETTARMDSPEVVPGKVIVDLGILQSFVDEPDHHFGLARKAFEEKDYATASKELVKCAGFVKLESMRAHGEDLGILKDAVDRLAALADEVKTGDVHSVQKLDDAYAHAELALAHHHQLLAVEAWNAQHPSEAGQDLKAASMHLENSLKYADKKTETDAKDAIDDANDLGEKLVAGTAIAADKVGKGMQNLGAKIEDWGKKMMAPKK